MELKITENKLWVRMDFNGKIYVWFKLSKNDIIYVTKK